eukprot:1829997-Lingulodinium_polyedra.AAC.1
MGLSQARAAWLVEWIANTLERGRAPLPELYSAVGRLGFVAQVLSLGAAFPGAGVLLGRSVQERG